MNDTIDINKPETFNHRRLVWLCVAGSIVAVSACLLIVWGFMSHPTPTVVLANGWQIRIDGLTYGTNHVEPRFPVLLKRLPPTLKLRAMRWLGVRGKPKVIKMNEPGLVAWMSIKKNSTPLPVLGLRLKFQLTQPGGEIGGVATHIRLTGTSPKQITAEFPVFPRRDRDLALQVSERFSVLAPWFDHSILFPNPGYTNPPSLQASALPLRITNGPYVCVVNQLLAGSVRALQKSLYAGTEYRRSVDWRVDDDEQIAVVDLSVRFKDQELVGHLVPMEISDATGNHLRPNDIPTISGVTSIAGSSINRTGQLLLLRAGLWTDDPWRIDLQIPSVPPWLREPEDTVRFDRIPVPRSAATNLMGQTIRIGSRVFELRRVSRLTLQMPSKDNPEIVEEFLNGKRVRKWSGTSTQNSLGSFEEVRVEITATGIVPEERIMFLPVLNDQGQPVESQSGMGGGNENGTFDMLWSCEGEYLKSDSISIALAMAGKSQPQSFSFILNPAKP